MVKALYSLKNNFMMDPETVDNIIESIIYLTFSVVMFWFGDRRTAKFAKRLNDGNFTNK